MGRESRHTNVGAGRDVVREESLEDFVHSVKVGDVLEEDRQPDDVVHGLVDALHNSLDVIEALLGLLLDTTGNKFAGLRIDGQLGREIVVVRESHSL